MALFGKKKDDSQSGNGNGEPPAQNPAASDESPFQPQPEKARKWFDHARTAADSTNYAYALTCYANGLRLDPEEMPAHQGMYEAAVRHHGSKGKAASASEIRNLDGAHPVEKFVAAEFAWMRDVINSALGVKLIEAAMRADQGEFGRWFAPKLLNLLRNQKKPSKKRLVTAMRAFGAVGAWEECIEAGTFATYVDPADGELQNEIKNLSAQRAMDQGGYEEAGGAEGGFRKFVRDLDHQRDLEDEASLSGAGSSEDRVLKRAKEAYLADSQNPEAIQRYAQLVKKQGTPEADELAYRIYMKGFQDTNEFRFRMAASDVKIAQAEQNVRSLQEQVAATPDDEELKSRLEQARRDMLKYKAAEFAEREAQYPTDRQIKFLRGEVEFQLANYESAMAAFQQAKDEPKLRVRAGHRLGLCFAAEGWHVEAEGEFKEALGAIDATTRDFELTIRYDLMSSLFTQAQEEQSIDRAKEALEICSGIARRDITFRDIRSKRNAIDELVKELTG